MRAVTATEAATPPDDAWARAVCAIGQGDATCRFLVMGASGWGCGKHDLILREQFDRRHELRSMVARSDNCSGRAMK